MVIYNYVIPGDLNRNDLGNEIMRSLQTEIFRCFLVLRKTVCKALNSHRSNTDKAPMYANGNTKNTTLASKRIKDGFFLIQMWVTMV